MGDSVEYLSVPQVAAVLRVSRSTVLRQIRAGILAAENTNPGGQRARYRVTEGAVTDFAQRMRTVP